ncbi:MAG: hypothetical protein RL722_515 [Pseudomonadota bacterium]|jgi:hypothetical protein
MSLFKSMSLASCLAPALLALVASLPVQAADGAATPASGVAPKARPTTNQRSVHLQLRKKCEAQAQEQGLQGEERKVQIARCLQGK